MRSLLNCFANPCSAPYRVFFTLGSILGIASIGIWTFFAIGIESVNFYPGFHHIFGVVSLFLGSFIVGFLLTALPRFTATPPASKGLVYLISLICAGEIVSLIFQENALALILCSLKFLMIQLFAISRIKNAKFTPPPSFIWIGAGLLSVVAGAFGKGLTELGLVTNIELSQIFHLAFSRGYILSLFMGIGSQLIPILSGVRVARPLTIQNGGLISQQGQRITHAVLAVLFFVGLILEAAYQNEAMLMSGLFIQFFVVSTEILFIWKMYRKPEASARGRALSLSSWAMVTGFALALAFPAQRIHVMHVVYVLGFLGGTLAIGAHVLVNHEAMDQALLKKPWPLGLITLSILFATILRTLAPFWELYYLTLLGISSTLVILALSLWGGYFVSPLWKNKLT